MPDHGPWKPIHLTPLPRKSSVAVCPGANPRAAVPPLHGRDVLPRFQPALYEMAVSPSSMRTVIPPVALVTVTAPEVVVLPAASRARAVSVCDPAAAVVVSHAVEYGTVVSSAPTGEPSTKNWTPTTPMLSDALAVTVTVPDTVAPDAGAVIRTDGAV